MGPVQARLKAARLTFVLSFSMLCGMAGYQNL